MTQLHLPRIGDRVLVVIDMQVAFWSSQKAQVLRSCTTQIDRAKANGWAILFLEYYGYGSTDERLRRRVGNYNRFTRMVKRSDDGSLETLAACQQLDWPTDYFRCVGVNTLACVSATVRGLLNQRAKVEVWGPACNDHNFGYGPSVTSRLVAEAAVIGHKRSCYPRAA